MRACVSSRAVSNNAPEKRDCIPYWDLGKRSGRQKDKRVFKRYPATQRNHRTKLWDHVVTVRLLLERLDGPADPRHAVVRQKRALTNQFSVDDVEVGVHGVTCQPTGG